MTFTLAYVVKVMLRTSCELQSLLLYVHPSLKQRYLPPRLLFQESLICVKVCLIPVEVDVSLLDCFKRGILLCLADGRQFKDLLQLGLHCTFLILLDGERRL